MSCFCSITNRGNYGLETRTLYRIKSTTQRISSLEKSQISKPAIHRQAKEEKREEKKDNQPRNPRNQKRNLLRSQLRCLNRNPRRRSPISPMSPKRQRISRHQTWMSELAASRNLQRLLQEPMRRLLTVMTKMMLAMRRHRQSSHTMTAARWWRRKTKIR